MADEKGDASTTSQYHTETPNNKLTLPTAVSGINNARGFFLNQGFTLGENGLLAPPFTQNQLTALRDYRNSVFTESVEMPTLKDFYRSVLMAVSLYPQIINGEIQYLLGRGVGIETALRGTIANRQKSNLTFSYRPHSDFDLYGVDTEPAYPSEFSYVFGNQEYYPSQATKALKNLPLNLLHKTAETVNLGGISILIPQLEILVLDKLLNPEATPRTEGSDALVAALQYELDRKLILEHYEQFVVEPTEGPISQECARIAENITGRLQKQQPALEAAIMQHDGISRSQARRKINEGITSALTNPTEAQKTKEPYTQLERESFASFDFARLGDLQANASSDYRIARAAEDIDPNLWIPLSPTDISEIGEISTEYKQQLIARVKAIHEASIRKTRAQKIYDFFYKVDQTRNRMKQ